MENDQTFNGMNLKKKNAFILCCLFLTSMIILASLVVFYISNHIIIVSMGYKIIELENIKAELEKQNKKCELLVDTLSALDRIESIAKKELGMIRPEQVEFIALNTNASFEEMEDFETVSLYAKNGEYLWASVDLSEKNNLILGVLK
jgi:cell division protein FtsL